MLRRSVAYVTFPTMNRSSSASSSSSSKHVSSSTIDSSVTRLLVSTKHLLESLTQWTRQEVDDKFVSDAYVKLGNDFRAAVRAFSNARIDVSDIGDVPKALRIVLESALSEPPSQENLDRFLPNIRSIIVNLLQNLKQKQLKVKGQEDSLSSKPQMKSSFTGKHELTNRPSVQRDSKSLDEFSSYANSVEMSGACLSLKEYEGLKEGRNKKDALKQLQETKAILRRASKRFSAYQFAKLANASKPTLPPVAGNLDEPEIVSTKSEASIENRRSVTAFFTIGDKTKKVDLEKPITMASIRLCFVERFGYSPGSTIFPDIYIEDKKNNVSFELEEHQIENEIVDGVVLFLKEQSKVAITEDVHSKIKDIEANLKHFTAEIRYLLDGFADSVKLATQTLNTPFMANSNSVAKVNKELTDIARELRTIKQIQSSHKNDVLKFVNDSIALTTKLREVSWDEPVASGRQYMDNSYAKLSGDSDYLLTKVDDLLDLMEALRKDVAQRGVRIGEKQLKNAESEIESAKFALHSLRDFIGHEKPMWKKLWEQELDKVCEEQQFITLQDDLTRDLAEDIKKLEETFDLIKKCSTQQGRITVNRRYDFASRMNLLESGESLHGIKDAIMSEVAALVPNHTDRLEAIAKAERIRHKERELMGGDQFQEELGAFVSEHRLKKSGGIEELERLRRAKDDEILKMTFGGV